MKTTLKIALIVALMSTFTAVKVSSQTVVTGRVFAEVVESVSASSMAVTDLNISLVNSSSSQTVNADTNGDLNLGKISVNSGESVICNVIMSNARVSAPDGKEIVIETSLETDSSVKGIIGGNSSYDLKGKAVIDNTEGLSKSYMGTYKMIFAYN